MSIYAENHASSWESKAALTSVSRHAFTLCEVALPNPFFIISQSSIKGTISVLHQCIYAVKYVPALDRLSGPWLNPRGFLVM